MDREEIKLIKSFKVIKPIKSTLSTGTTTIKKGEIIVLRKYQGQIGISLLDMYFENEKNEHTFSLGCLIDNIDKYVVVHEKFKKLKDKFDYIS